MKSFLTALVCAVGLAASGAQATAAELRVPVSLTSFGAAQAISSYQMSAAGLVLGPAQTFSPGTFAATATVMPVAYGIARPQSFAASQALTINLALDAGFNLDLARRFQNYDALQSPLLDQTSFLSLANGGSYLGMTFAPSPSLRMRLGAQVRNDRLDSFTFDPTLNGLPALYNDGVQRSLLGGVSWDITDWAGINLSGIYNEQRGRNLNPMAELAPRASTNALSVSAHMNLGGGWVTNASFTEALTQLDQKGSSKSVDSHAYAIAIAKHGLFGGDAVGFSYSRPAVSLLDNRLEMVAASGDLPPVFLTSGRLPGATPETDLQLGYVTSFLDGALALQANAAYQMNYQGQTGATSLAVLSRAKIKF